MEMPKPSPAHARLERLAGRWRGTEQMQPSQWDPEGGAAVGRSTSRLALNGFALITDYEQERDGAVTFSGHGVYTCDPETEVYRLHWFDGLGSPPEVFTGRFDGDVLTLAHGGPGMHVRMTTDLTAPGVMVSKMEMSPDGVDWKTLFDGRYERA